VSFINLFMSFPAFSNSGGFRGSKSEERSRQVEIGEVVRRRDRRDSGPDFGLHVLAEDAGNHRADANEFLEPQAGDVER
jgi:hypothetical protein